MLNFQGTAHLNGVGSLSQIYENPYWWGMDEASYVEEDISFSDLNGTSKISEIIFKSNTITASVEATQNTFLNFSQTYCPGWKACVDGNETKIYQVNGIIQGIEIPKGMHSIKFCYSPRSFKIGLLITLATLLSIALYCYRKRVKVGIEQETSYEKSSIK